MPITLMSVSPTNLLQNLGEISLLLKFHMIAIHTMNLQEWAEDMPLALIKRITTLYL